MRGWDSVQIGNMIRGSWDREPKIHSDVADEGDKRSSEDGSRPVVERRGKDADVKKRKQ